MELLNQLNSLRQIVAAINTSATESVSYFGGTFTGTPEDIAAAYAIQRNGYPIYSATIEAHLDILSEAGANFSYPDALEIAEST